jgi:prepilin-type N-terminal cleavage/methylation domain-containing protein
MRSLPEQQGFSLIELLVALSVITIFMGIALISFASTSKYQADDQALEIIDVLNQARQSALNQNRTFRVEINKTKNRITLINENLFDNADDDEIVNSVALRKQVFVNIVPSNIVANPTYSSPIPVLDYVTSNYPISSGEEKITLRFKSNGRVLDTGSDNIGTGSLMRGATIYVYTNKDKTSTPEIIRAVTVSQTSGSASILKCTFDASGKCGNWAR